jgi:hypothetical protein
MKAPAGFPLLANDYARVQSVSVDTTTSIGTSPSTSILTRFKEVYYVGVYPSADSNNQYRGLRKSIDFANFTDADPLPTATGYRCTASTSTYLYASVGTALYRTTDGVIWTGFSAAADSSIAAMVAVPGGIFLVTNIGSIYYASDAGAATMFQQSTNVLANKTGYGVSTGNQQYLFYDAIGDRLFWMAAANNVPRVLWGNATALKTNTTAAYWNLSWNGPSSNSFSAGMNSKYLMVTYDGNVTTPLAQIALSDLSVALKNPGLSTAYNGITADDLTDMFLLVGQSGDCYYGDGVTPWGPNYIAGLNGKVSYLQSTPTIRGGKIFGANRTGSGYVAGSFTPPGYMEVPAIQSLKGAGGVVLNPYMKVAA